MATLDWALLAVLAVSLLLGAWRGFVFEVLSLAGWVLAFVVARWFAADAGALLPWGAGDASWRPAAGFALLFIAVVFACGLLAALARKLITAAGLRPADRALGALFGVARGVLLLIVVVWAAGYTPLPSEPWWQASRLAPLLQGAVNGLGPVLPSGWTAPT
ncbi:MAG: CvpA family protein [Comamonadaceae bacterium]|nr:CvpA family protein [Burkholderiales bacterium]MEB2347412.1 CvpA family protein [Comamonadaceae bacterium]